MKENQNLKDKKSSIYNTIMTIKVISLLLLILSIVTYIFITFTSFQIMSVLLTMCIIGSIVLTLRNPPGW